MRNRILFTALTALLAFAFMSADADEASAQFRVGPHVGFNIDSDNLFIGVDGWIGIYRITDLVSIHGNPGLSYYFVDGDASLFIIDLDVQFLFEVNDTVAPYVGPGLGVAFVSVGDFSDTDIEFSISGGALFLHDQRIQPFAEARLRSVADGNGFELAGGALFQF